MIKFDAYGPRAKVLASQHGILLRDGGWKIERAAMKRDWEEGCKPIDVDFVDTLDIQTGLDAALGALPEPTDRRAPFEVALFHEQSWTRQCPCGASPMNFPKQLSGRSVWTVSTPVSQGKQKIAVFDAGSGELLQAYPWP